MDAHSSQTTNGYPVEPPDSVEGLKALVVSRRLEFPERMRQIGMYAFQHPHQMAFMTIQEIARATGTSASSVHRFAKTFGFDDYTALRRVFQKHIALTARENDGRA